MVLDLERFRKQSDLAKLSLEFKVSFPEIFRPKSHKILILQFLAMESDCKANVFPLLHELNANLRAI